MLTSPESLLTVISSPVFIQAPTTREHFTTSYGQWVKSVVQIVEYTVRGTQVTFLADCTVHLPVWMSCLEFHAAVLDGRKNSWVGVASVLQAASACNHGYHSNPTTPKFQHTSNQEQYDQSGNSTE